MNFANIVDFLFRKNKILSPFIVISLLRKIGFKEMNVQKFRNFVITEFVKSGIHCNIMKPKMVIMANSSEKVSYLYPVLCSNIFLTVGISRPAPKWV